MLTNKTLAEIIYVDGKELIHKYLGKIFTIWIHRSSNLGLLSLNEIFLAKIFSVGMGRKKNLPKILDIKNLKPRKTV